VARRTLRRRHVLCEPLPVPFGGGGVGGLQDSENAGQPRGALEERGAGFDGEFFEGLTEVDAALLANSSSCCCRYHDPAPGPRPPSSSGLEASAITLAGLKVHLLPSPWHSSQAP